MYYHSCNRPIHACLSAKPSQSWLWHNSKHTITSTYDARTLVLFNSKIIHPKQSDSNTSSSIQQAHFYHLRQGVTYPKQWVQQRLLADSLMRDNYTKSTASVRSYGALVKWEDSQYNNPTLDFNHMSIYNLKDTHHKNWYLIFWYQPSRLKVYISSCRHNKKHAFRSWPEHLYMLGLHGILVWVNSGIMTFNVHSDQV